LAASPGHPDQTQRGFTVFEYENFVRDVRDGKARETTRRKRIKVDFGLSKLWSFLSGWLKILSS
jgi:hypothetical protein